MFRKNLPDNAPYIQNVSYVKGYDLFITFDNGEQRIFDASNQMRSPTALLYQSLEEFKKFHFDYGGVYWGENDDFGIMHDTLYDFSFPFSAIVSSSGQYVSLSMSWVTDVSSFPIEVIARNKSGIRMYVHSRGEDHHHLPHVHVDFRNTRTPFTLKGEPITKVPKVMSGKILRATKKWILANTANIAEVWNKENPNSPIDSTTGDYLK